MKEESDEIKFAKAELAAKRAKFPGLCLPDDTEKVEVIQNRATVTASVMYCRSS